MSTMSGKECEEVKETVEGSARKPTSEPTRMRNLCDIDKLCCERLGRSAESLLCDLNSFCGLAPHYARAVAEMVLGNVAKDLPDTADGRHWNPDDLRLAFGRVVAARFGIDAGQELETRMESRVKVYNVLFETNYENEDVHSVISTFDSLPKARKCVEEALDDEIRDGGYTKEELESRLVRDGVDHFCFYSDDSQSNWKFRAVVYENEVK